MNVLKFEEYIEAGRFAEVEDLWLEQLSNPEATVDDFLQICRALGRQKEKDRAGVLLGLLADQLKEKEKWRDRLRVLLEIAKHTQDARRFADVKADIEETLKRLHPDSPSFQTLITNLRYRDLRTYEDLKPAVDKIRMWLTYDVGRIFYEPGRGIGKVLEINVNLNVIRLDFETRRDVRLQVGDTDLVPLEKGHILREKFEESELFERKAMESPGLTLTRLLQALNRPLTAGEIKACLSGGIPENQWSRWWTAAKRDPHIVVSGKGVNATYSWSESVAAADETVKTLFDESSLHDKLALVKQHIARSSELANYFRGGLSDQLKDAYAKGQMGQALEILEVVSRWPEYTPADPRCTFEEIIKNQPLQSLVPSIDNSALKIKVLEAAESLSPSGFVSNCVAVFLGEENPKVQSFLADLLLRRDPAAYETAIRRILERPFSHAAAFAWICERVGKEHNQQDPTWNVLDGKFLLSVFASIDEPEFAAFRTRLKKVLENGLLIQILHRGVDPDIAQRAVDLLDQCKYLEDYRRDRWKNTIRARFPETRQKEEWIFTTQQALDRKRTEMEHLVNVELPANRKAVGEAAALGDLSENHEYKAARERQDYLINRIQQLQKDIARARIIEPGKSDCSEVRPGTKVVLAHSPQKHLDLTILGPWDSNPQGGIYSYQSPIAMKLLGKLPGEQVDWNDVRWTIEKIEPWG